MSNAHKKKIAGKYKFIYLYIIIESIFSPPPPQGIYPAYPFYFPCYSHLPLSFFCINLLRARETRHIYCQYNNYFLVRACSPHGIFRHLAQVARTCNNTTYRFLINDKSFGETKDFMRARAKLYFSDYIQSRRPPRCRAASDT